jgi:hypothetical protein
MSDAKFKENLLKFGGIDANRGNMYLRGNIRMLGNGSYMSQLTVKDMVVTGNAVIPGISFDSLTVAGNVVSTDGNFIGNGALMTGITSTLPTEANIDIYGNVDGTYANVRNVAAISGNIGNVRMAGGNVSASGQVNVRGNVVARGFIGNGALLTDVKISGNQTIDILGNVQGENANVGVIAAIFGNIGNVVMAGGNMSASGQVNVLGNVTADYFIGNGALLTGILTDLPDIANVDIRGNVTGTYAILENIDAAFGNVGDVEMSGGNMSVSGQVNVAGNVVANCFIGNGALLTGVVLTPPAIANADIRGNVIGAYANVHNVVAMYGNVGNVMISGGNVSVSGQVNVLGNVAANCFIGNGTLLTDLTVTGNQFINILGNVRGEYVNVETVIATFGNVGNVRMENDTVFVGGQVDVLGNVVAEYVIGNGALLTGVILPPVAVIDILGNVDGAYANVHNVVAMYGNVGNVVIENGNVNASGQVNVAGNVVANYFIGNGALFTDIDLPPIANFDIRGNVAGIYANVENIVGIFGNIGNVEMSGGNMSVSGQVNILGNGVANYFIGNGSLLANLAVFGNQTIDTLGNVRGEYVNVETVIATFGNVGAVVMENGNVSVAGQVDVLGNVVAGYFIGNGSLLTDVGLPHVVNIDIRGNVIGTYANVRNVAAISGNIGNVVMSGGNVSIGGQVNVFGNVMAEYFFGDGALLSTLEGAFVKVDAQVDVLGNVTAGYIIGNGALLEGIISADIPPVANVDIRGNVDGTYANVSNLTASVGNIGNVRLENGTVSVSGQVDVLRNVVANCFIGNGALLTGLLADLPSSANIDIRGNVDGTYANVSNLTAAVGNIGSIRIENGNMSVRGQVNVLGNVVANCFIGNGALLTGLGGRPARYVSVKRTQDQEIKPGTKWKDTVIVMDSITEQNGVQYDVTKGTFKLEKGVTYRITAQLTWIATNGSYRYPFKLINYDTGEQIGILAEAIPPKINNTNDTAGAIFDILHTPKNDITCCLKMGECDAGNVEKLRHDVGTFLNIVETKGGILSSGLPPFANADVEGTMIGNIANVNNLTALFGNVGNVAMQIGNVKAMGYLNVRGNVVANCFIGDGSLLTNTRLNGAQNSDIMGNVNGNYINVHSVQASMIGNIGNTRMENGNMTVRGQVNIAGNIIAGYFDGNGVLLTDVTINNIQNIDISGNVRSGDYITVKNVTAGIFGNIGNVIMEQGNLTTRGRITLTGNVVANCFYGNGIQLRNVQVFGVQKINIKGNVTGDNVDVGNINATVGNIGNVRMETGNIKAPAGNIGNVRMGEGDILFPGQVDVTGNVSAKFFIGNGALLKDVILGGIQRADINGNVRSGGYIKVSNVAAGIFGNIGNVVMEKGKISASAGIVGNVRMEKVEMYSIGQVIVRGNIVANCFNGDGSLLTNVILRGTQNIDIIGNVIDGSYINVHRVTASIGNIGNVIMEKENITANVGNIANVVFAGGNITAVAGDIGGVVLRGGNIDIRGQVNVRGNAVANCFIGDGSEVTNIAAIYVLPSVSNVDIEGNVVGNYINVGNVHAISGNIGNTRMVGGNVNVTGQVNVRGNVVANVFIGDIISTFGNVGNIRMQNGDMSVSGQVNARRDVVATNFIGNGAGVYDTKIPIEFLTLVLKEETFYSDPTLVHVTADMEMKTGNRIPFNTGGFFRLLPRIPYRITAQLGLYRDDTKPTPPSDEANFNAFRFGLWSVEGNDFVGGITRPQLPFKTNTELPPATKFLTSGPLLDIIIIPPDLPYDRASYSVRFTNGATQKDVYLSVYGTFVTVQSLTNGPQGPPLTVSWNKATLELKGAKLGTPGKRKYIWSVSGDIMNMKGYYCAPENNTEITGHGEYLLHIPESYTIHTSITGVAPDGVAEGISIGQLKLCTATAQYTGEVLAYDDAHIKFVIWSSNDNEWFSVGGEGPGNITSIRSLYFTADVPVIPK